MSSIDERVVEMKFENSAFKTKAAETVGALKGLKDNLKFDGAGRGLEEAARGVGSFQGHIAGVAASFSSLQAVAFGALASIGSKIASTGQEMATALTLSPVTSGLKEYETNLNSIQTILANTKASGATLDDVNHSLEELNHYSDETIYNFSQMANAIGMFTASGVDLETSTASIKGIANLAALSGSSAEQAAGLYRQLSQAISSGKVSLMDWQSVVTANMGGTVFQRALAQTAVAMGELDESALKLEGSMQNVKINGESFRDSISAEGGGESWLSSDVLVTTLRTFTGDMKAGELAAIGFKQAQIDSIIAQADTAKAAAQDVKTLGQAFDIAKEVAGSGWAYTWQIIMGDFEEAKTTFTAFSNWINGFIKSSADSRNELLKGWKAAGGRDMLLGALSNAAMALQGVIKPLIDAFRVIFPAMTVDRLVAMTAAFRDFTARLVPSTETISKLKSTFVGLFSVLGIVWEFVKAGVTFIGQLIGRFTEGSSGILDFTANIGNFLFKVHKAVKEGEVFTKFFDKLAEYINPVIDLIRKVAKAIGDFFTGESVSSGTADAMERLGSVSENLGEIADDASAAWQSFIGFLSRAADKIRPIFEWIGDFFGTIGGAIGDFLSELSFGDIMAGVGTGAAVALVAAIRKFLGNFSLSGLFGGGGDEGPGMLDSLRDALDSLTDTFSAMQNALNAGALLAIAAAIGIMTLSVMALSDIPANDLAKAVSAIATLVTELAAAAWVFGKFKMSDTVKVIALGIGLSFLAVAIRILVSSVKALSDLDWDELAKGASTIAVLLATLAGALKLMSYSETKKIIRTGIALAIIAGAIHILVSAMERLKDLNWEELAQGFAGVAALLGALGLFTRFSQVNNLGFGAGLGLVLLATAILILGEAIEKIAELDWHELARGMAGFAVALGIMVGAFRLLKKVRVRATDTVGFILIATSMLIVGEALEKLAELDWGDFAQSLLSMGIALALMTAALVLIPKGAVFSGVALILVATSLLIVGEALEKLGAMKWEDIGAALVQLGVVMGIIGLFMAFAATGVGAVAMITLAASLIIIAGALLILSFVMERLGAMSWSDIGAAIGGLTLLFIVLALGGALSPLILLLAVALGVLAGALLIAGGAIYLAGQGFDSFTDAIERLSEIDAEGIQNVVDNLTKLLELIPVLAEQAALGIVAFVTTLGENAPEMSEAMGDVIIAFAERIAEDTPIIVEAFGTMMVDTLTKLGEYVPDMIVAAANLIVGMLEGIAREVPRIATAGTNLVTAFLRAIGDNAGKIANEGMMMIIKIITALTIAIQTYGPALRQAASSLGDAIIDGLTGGLWGGSDKVNAAAQGVAGKALTAARQTLGVKSPSKKFMEIGQYAVQGFVQGLRGDKGQVTKAVQDMLGKLNDIMYDSRNRADAARRSLENLHQAKKKDWKEIDRQNKILAEANNELTKAANAHWMLAKHLTAHRHKLMQLADQQTVNNKKLEEANDKLADAKKLRDDYNASVKEDLSDRPEFDARTNLTKYIADFERQITDTKKFATAVQELRKRGLNDTMYKELIAKGPEAMPFVQQLLDQGTEGVKKLNTLGLSLDKVAGDLATTASKSLYQAGVDSAQGLVDGLKKKQKEIADYMKWLSTVIVNAVKGQLGIRSPSKVFEEIGKQTTQGLADGLLKSSSAVSRSADTVGTRAIESMRKTLTGLGDAITGEMDMTPVISPVLDLNAVRKDASLLNSMLAVNPIDITDQVTRAKDAAAGLRDNQLALEALTVEGSGDTIAFTQNNYSPKALSSADIYRQTNNQLSRAKGALAT